MTADGSSDERAGAKGPTPLRETVGMVCQTCGTDYGAAAPSYSPRIVAVPYVPGEGCDCPPPWGGVHKTNPDCPEHGEAS